MKKRQCQKITASRKPGTALVSLLSVALSSVSVKQVYYTTNFIITFYIFENCPLYWVHINPSVAPRQLTPQGFPEMSNARFRDLVKQGSLGLCEFHNVKFQLFIITPCELADFVGGALHPASLSRCARGAICAWLACAYHSDFITPTGVYIIKFAEFVYHQHNVLYIIIAEENTAYG